MLRGKGRRVSGPAADDADGPLELDPVRVDARFGGGPADQGRQGVMSEQVAVDLLADHVRALGPQHLLRASQGRLELGIPGFMLPPSVVGLRQQRRCGCRHLGDRGDQGDHLAVAVAVPVRDLVPGHPDITGLALVQLLPAAGRLQDCLPGLTADLRVHQHR